MRRIILLGAPGSGKSTQGQMLAEYLGCPWVSTGELFRQSTEPEILEVLKTAALVDDQVTFRVLSEELLRLQQSGAGEDAVIDGFPRTKVQAEMALGLGITEVIEIEVSEEELISRLMIRGREQDTREIVTERIRNYQMMLEAVLAVLTGAGVPIKKVNGVGTIEEVFSRVKEVL